jgi:hypothetical protein
MLCERIGDAGDAGIPGDVPRQFAGRQPEIAEPARDQASVMIRGQQEWRAAFGINFVNRRNIFVTKE